MGSDTESWKAKAAAKRANTLAKIYPQWRLSPGDIERASTQRDLTGPFIQQFLDHGDISIVSMDSLPIVNAIKQGSLTSLQVATAFCKAAAVAHQIGNCLHEIFFDEALERAKELDEHYKKHGATIGPLHGLPVSLKDQFHVKGLDTTAGYVGYIGSNLGVKDPSRAHQVESQITAELRSLGAVLYCKTSVPQTLFYTETQNHIIGETLNPHNQNLTCGGSSGGEGALLALRGSTLGVGADIGGSVRIPAAYNGVFGIKPTPERFSCRDVATSNAGQTTYPMAVGFLSTSIDGIGLMLKSILSTQPWLQDPTVVPIPFRQDVVDEYLQRTNADGTAKQGQRPLKLGILWTDGVVHPHPPVTRSLHMVVDAVEKAGHKVIDWVPPSHEKATKIHLSIIRADGAGHVHRDLKLSGEPLIPALDNRGMNLRPPMDLLKFQDLASQGLDFEAQYSEYWNSTAKDDGQIVDAVIMPVAPHAANIPGKLYHIDYTEALNLLNYSVAVIPVTKVDKVQDPVNDDYRPLNKKDEKNWKAYDPETYHGGPVGVQIVARKFEEEKVWAIAKIVYAALQKVEDAGSNSQSASDVKIPARL
ncbi:amidase [Annulohypoxylon maeteangense]|uniref:amidase n=1 Tax=Annulohypoxylon maeteangense TaxID=1927788 RepID=UPI0020085160|nr:amidase [Annulohypoxylon maeteangense]KAI0882064.1 amidase [Annulohypoxylon maeteangense]